MTKHWHYRDFGRGRYLWPYNRMARTQFLGGYDITCKSYGHCRPKPCRFWLKEVR